jgi:hypothetical protein
MVSIERAKWPLISAAAAIIGLMGGLVGGAMAIYRVEENKCSFLLAVRDDRRLADEVMVLKVLDEGKADVAKTLLETAISLDAKSVAGTLEGSSSVPMRQQLERTLRVANLALADRTKSFDQIQKEVDK